MRKVFLRTFLTLKVLISKKFFLSQVNELYSPPYNNIFFRPAIQAVAAFLVFFVMLVRCI